MLPARREPELDQESHPRPEPGRGQQALPLSGLRQVTVEQQSYQGPIPMASELQAYEDTLPGLADRIVGMAEREAQHRQRMESRDLALEHFHVGFGQVSALVVAIFFGWIAYQLGQEGKELLAAFVGAIDLAALVGVFIYGKRQEGQPPEPNPPDRPSAS